MRLFPFPFPSPPPLQVPCCFPFPSSARRLTSAAREVASTARRRAHTSAARSRAAKGSIRQYGEVQQPHGLREFQGRKRPIRRGCACSAPVRPCSCASYLSWTSPRASSPPASPSFPTVSATPRRLRGCPGTTHLPSPLPSDEYMANSGTVSELTNTRI